MVQQQTLQASAIAENLPVMMAVAVHFHHFCIDEQGFVTSSLHGVGHGIQHATYRSAAHECCMLVQICILPWIGAVSRNPTVCTHCQVWHRITLASSIYMSAVC